MITIYSRPGCSACRVTKGYLSKNGIDFLEVDISTDPSAEDYVRRLGHVSLPVVVAGSEHWAGLQPDRLLALKLQ